MGPRATKWVIKGVQWITLDCTPLLGRASEQLSWRLEKRPKISGNELGMPSSTFQQNSRTRMAGKKPPLIVLITSFRELAPLTMAVDARKTNICVHLQANINVWMAHRPATCIGEIRRLLAMIWRILSREDVFPSKAF